MTIDEARTQLAAMFGAATIPDATLDAALQQSLTWDAARLRPGMDGYQTTYDLAWAAAEVCTLMAMQAATTGPQLTKISSEGTTMELAGGIDWWALAHQWRLRSPLAQATGYGSTLGVISIDQGTTYVPTSDGLRGAL